MLPECQSRTSRWTLHRPKLFAWSKCFHRMKTKSYNASSHMRRQTLHIAYVCLSYVWGTDEPTDVIYINERPYRVRRNLWCFLRTASKMLHSADPVLGLGASYSSQPERHYLDRDTCVGQLIWIDALCIDQENTLEKNHQVQQMGETYGKSQRVVVWFGSGSYAQASMAKYYPPTDLSWYSGTVSHARIFMRGFCEDAYWKIAWTTHEVLLARDITFLTNRQEARWTKLKEELGRVLGFAGHSYSQYQPLYDIVERQSRCTLLENIWRHRHKKCTDRRDLIYSLLSLSDLDLVIEVYYEITLSILALRVVRSLGPAACLYSAKVLQSALKYAPELRNGEDYPFAIVNLSQPLPYFSWNCPCCSESLDLTSVAIKYLPSLEYRIYCLGCFHKDSSKRPMPGDRALRHGHLILSQHGISRPTLLWSTHCLPPNRSWAPNKPRDLIGPLQGVRVLKMNDDGSTSLQTSTKDFALSVSSNFEARYMSRENVGSFADLTGRGYQNPTY